MNTFYIFHFRPIEHYPPIQNLLNYLSESASLDRLYCFSTKGHLENFQLKRGKLLRLGKVGGGKAVLWLSYALYNLYSIVVLMLKRPDKVMYFESLSAFPVYVYKSFINKRAEVYIHYHEYTTIEQYRRASAIERWFHRLEKKLYKKARRISHTNEVRLSKFLKDEGLSFDSRIHKIMPNYPSKKWAIKNTKWKEGQKLKFIYVGYSLTKEGSYLGELIDFLKKSQLPIEVNVYCMKETDFAKSFEVSGQDFTFKLHKALAYKKLPKVLSQHHIGLILYRAKTPNYIYNAPNKLFEYLSCGLDVWYPEEMEGIHEYDCDMQPKVLRLDFKQMEKYNLMDLIRESPFKNNISYFAEDVYSELLKEFK